MGFTVAFRARAAKVPQGFAAGEGFLGRGAYTATVIDWLSELPEWAVVGLALGAAFTVVAAVAFLAGTRLFPEPDRGRSRGTSGESRRRAEIRAYLDGIGEEYAEDHPVCGQPVAFYLPARDVAITFDARAFFRIEGSGTHAVLAEHELPGAALGPRLPFETPDPEPEGSGDGLAANGDPVRSAFAELGLPSDADAATVKSAYRRQVKSVHPDQGGDPEAFKRLREAYTVAKEAAS